MADVNAQVALGINSPDPNQGLTTLSKIMSLGQQGLAIRGQQSQNQSLAAKATVDTQNAKEYQAGAQLLSDPVGNGLIDADGNPTKDAQKIVMQAMPNTGSEHFQGIITGAKSKIEFNRSVNNLTGDLRNEIAGVMSGAAADPNATKDDAQAQLNAYVESKKGTPVYDDVKRIAATTQKIDDHVQQKQDDTGQIIPPGKDAWRASRLTLGRTVLGAPAVVGSGGIAAPQATTVQTTGGTQGAVQAPALQGGELQTAGPVIAAPPTVIASPGGPIEKVAPGAGSMTPIPETGGPKTNAPAAGKLQPLPRPGNNAPAADIANYNARIKQAGDEQQAVSNAANDPQNGVQVSRYRNGQILDLTKVAPTGPGKEIWNHIASQFPGQGADAFQKIGHYLAQNSAAMAGKMGVPNTNMGQETAAAAAGNPAQNPEAIKEITKVNDALNTGFDLYNRGLAKVTNNGSDLSRVPAYKQAFGSSLDVNALRWADAHRRNDIDEINTLTKKGPQAIAEWQKKLATLKSLATMGDLP